MDNRIWNSIVIDRPASSWDFPNMKTRSARCEQSTAASAVDVGVHATSVIRCRLASLPVLLVSVSSERKLLEYLASNAPVFELRFDGQTSKWALVSLKKKTWAVKFCGRKNVVHILPRSFVASQSSKIHGLWRTTANKFDWAQHWIWP